MARKVTFTLDEESIERLAVTAERLRKPKSEVVREAIADYHDRAGRLSEAERQRLLGIIDTSLATLPRRRQAAVAKEIEAIRANRRSGGRGSR